MAVVHLEMLCHHTMKMNVCTNKTSLANASKPGVILFLLLIAYKETLTKYSAVPVEVIDWQHGYAQWHQQRWGNLPASLMASTKSIMDGIGWERMTPPSIKDWSTIIHLILNNDSHCLKHDSMTLNSMSKFTLQNLKAIVCHSRIHDGNKPMTWSAWALWNPLCWEGIESTCPFPLPSHSHHWAMPILTNWCQFVFQPIFSKDWSMTLSTPDWSKDPSNLWLIDSKSNFILVTARVVLVIIKSRVFVECRVLLLMPNSLRCWLKLQWSRCHESHDLETRQS